jgi:hypothetical protein
VPADVDSLGPIRRAVLFALGVAVIIDGLIEDNGTAEFVAGLVLVGLVPLDLVLTRRREH